MDNHHKGELRRALLHLSDCCKTVLQILEQPDRKQSLRYVEKATNALPVIEADVFTIRYRGKPCFLGNSLGYRLLLMLLENRGRYVSHEELLETIWCGKRSVSAIKSVISDLRRKLLKSGLADLAQALDGSLKGHYRLRLIRD